MGLALWYDSLSSPPEPTMTDTIKTNNVPRDTFYVWQLDDKEQKKIRDQFGYYTEDELEEQTFFKYQGYWYSLSDFMRLDNDTTFKGWDGACSYSYFSGTLIKLVEEFMGEPKVICGRFYS